MNEFKKRQKHQSKLVAKACMNFFSTGSLPWSPEICKSYYAGLSGVMYVLPAFYTPIVIEKVIWVSTAGISCLADYVYIGYKHPIQSFDQIIATILFLRMSYLIYYNMSLLSVVKFSIAPLSCYGLATYGKKINKPTSVEL